MARRPTAAHPDRTRPAAEGYWYDCKQCPVVVEGFETGAAASKAFEQHYGREHARPSYAPGAPVIAVIDKGAHYETNDRGVSLNA